MSITEFEEEIERRRNAFIEALNVLLITENTSPNDLQKLQQDINTVNQKATSYFKKFEDSIALYEHEDYKAGKNIHLAKVNSTKIVLDTIFNYWMILSRTYKPIEEICVPEPNSYAYMTMQQFLSGFDKEGAKELQKKYKAKNLPIAGFVSKKKFNPINYIQMTRKQQITFGIIAGVILLIALMIIALVFGCQTQQADKIFSVVLALASAAFAMALTGSFAFNNKIVNAGGPLGVFALLFFFNPAQVEDFKSCQSDVSGTVYYGDDIIDNVSVQLIKSDQSTSTNVNGNFTINSVDFASLADSVDVKLSKRGIQLDSIIKIDKKALEGSIDIRLPKHCVTCARTDSTGIHKGRVQKCSASNKYIKDYIQGYTKRSTELKLNVDCVEN